MKKSELNKLMQNIQNGDEISFTRFYQTTHNAVFSFIYSYIKNWHTTEDLLQETFIKVKLNADKFKVGTNVNAWVLQIAKNTCLDYLRRNNLKDTEELNEYMGEDCSDVVTNMYVHNLLNKYLGDIDRQVVLLHIIGGYKNREIAEILEIPIGTVLWRYNKAIKELQNKIKEDL